MILAVIVLLLVGGKKLPQLARSLGEAQREFRKGLGEGSSADELDERRGQGRDAPSD